MTSLTVRGAAASVAAALSGCATSQLADANTEACVVLGDFLADVASRRVYENDRTFVTLADGSLVLADLSDMPGAVVWPEIGLVTLRLDVPPYATEADKQWIDDFNRESTSEPIEDRVEQTRQITRERFDSHFTDNPGLAEVVDAYVEALSAPRMLECDWPDGVEQLALDENPVSFRGSRWRRVISTYVSGEEVQLAREPTMYTFSGVGMTSDGTAALIGYGTWTVHQGGFADGYGQDGFVLLRKQDGHWRIEDYLLTIVSN